jgi:hypothetical protein
VILFGIVIVKQIKEKQKEIIHIGIIGHLLFVFTSLRHLLSRLRQQKDLVVRQGLFVGGNCFAKGWIRKPVKKTSRCDVFRAWTFGVFAQAERARGGIIKNKPSD